MSRLRANVTVLMRDASDHVVPGSVRRGHNIMTADGHDALAQLLVSALGSPDVPYTQRRARWIGIGGGTQPEAKGVARLVTPLQVTAGVYLKALDHTLHVFPTITSVTVKTVFAPAEITYLDPAVVVSEAGLYFDVSPPGYLLVSSPNNVPAFYRTFEPLVKLNSFSMEVLWELKF